MQQTLEWFASISGMIAALMIAWDHSRRITGFGFVLFVACSASWIVAGLMEGDSALAAQNAVLIFINGLGIYRYLIRGRKAGEEGS
ncbi:MAG: hypothetical protein WA979_06790 [Pacificimonas sp.]